MMTKPPPTPQSAPKVPAKEPHGIAVEADTSANLGMVVVLVAQERRTNPGVGGACDIFRMVWRSATIEVFIFSV